MKTLSVFVDESGDMGCYQPHAPFYLLTLLLHDQSIDISQAILKHKESKIERGLGTYLIHAGPLIRRENEYRDMSLEERKRIFDCLHVFVRSVTFGYYSFLIDKKRIESNLHLYDQITRELDRFLSFYSEYIRKFDRIILYYDNGQREISTILAKSFNMLVPEVVYRYVKPYDYLLFQAADMICSLELIAEKFKRGVQSKSEIAFFGTERRFRREYLRSVSKKRIFISS